VAAHGDGLDAAERAAKALERLPDGGERDPQLEGRCGGGDRVVDVVEPFMPSRLTRVAATCGSGLVRPQFGQR
jgi:hypothetical protein